MDLCPAMDRLVVGGICRDIGRRHGGEVNIKTSIPTQSPHSLFRTSKQTGSGSDSRRTEL